MHVHLLHSYKLRCHADIVTDVTKNELCSIVALWCSHLVEISAFAPQGQGSALLQIGIKAAAGSSGSRQRPPLTDCLLPHRSSHTLHSSAGAITPVHVVSLYKIARCFGPFPPQIYHVCSHRADVFCVSTVHLSSGLYRQCG